MAQQNAERDIQIIEYHNGKPMHFYVGLQECASNFHCHTELIKGLIFTGQAFPYLEEKITFDIHPSSNCHIERNRDPKHSRYYRFDIVRDDEVNLEKKRGDMRGDDE